MLAGSIFIAYTHDQVRAIYAADPAAFIAIGASKSEQIERASAAGFDRMPYVGLAGDINSAAAAARLLAERGHFVLAGTYLGLDPADARNEAQADLPDVDAAVSDGVQLLVSNQPVAMAGYLARNGLAVDPAGCPTAG